MSTGKIVAVSAIFPLSFLGLVGYLVTGWSALIVLHFVAIALAVYISYTIMEAEDYDPDN